MALLGDGLAGRVFHAPFLSAVPGFALRAIVSRRTEEVGRAWPGVDVLGSVDEVFQDDRFDLVVVATPNETHDALARRALEAGKHVVVDKAAAPTSAQVRALADVAAERGLVFAPFHNRRWDGDFLTVQRLLAEGALGRLVSFESHFDRFRPLPREGTWKEDASEAHGLLMDLGPHLVDQALALFGPPRTLVASVRRDRDGSAIDDAFDLWLEYDGLQVMLRSTLIAAEAAPRFLLHGTRGSYRKFGVDPQEPALVAGAAVPRLGEQSPWLAEDASCWGELATAAEPESPERMTRVRVPTAPGDYRGFYGNVLEAVRGETALAVTPEDAWRTMRVLELARESSRGGGRVRVELAGWP